MDPEVIEKLVSYCQNVSHISHLNCFMNIQNDNSEDIFLLIEKEDQSQIYRKIKQLGFVWDYFSQIIHTSLAWTDENMTFDSCVDDITKGIASEIQNKVASIICQY